MNSTRDEQYMRLALKLAAQARDSTLPNPKVGAVVVRAGRVLGKGFHRKAGQAHAEVLALAQAGSRAKGATLYVTLEPCSHTGRTPPCTQTILRFGVSRVVAAMRDPNPLNRGRGIRHLQRRGVRAQVGLLEAQARALNPAFITRMEKERPFVTVKVAQSLDGKIATSTGDSRWISGSVSRNWVAKLRRESDAVLVGIRTLLQDDPRLTVRVKKSSRQLKGKVKQPVRVILDSQLRTPPSARLFSSKSPVWIATLNSAPRSREKPLRASGAEVFRLPAARGRVSLKALLKRLSQREISRLLIEGGGEVIDSAFQAGAVDQVAWVVAPKIIGGSQAPGSVGGVGFSDLRRVIRVEQLRVKRLGSDILMIGKIL
jgi:diaminohydroxyphosphoribosylaminopyrimidine deaminase / 5-amino-6-(5-phosphoribosylamino)uracil reductase